jgi:hypothetical protein
MMHHAALQRLARLSLRQGVFGNGVRADVVLGKDVVHVGVVQLARRQGRFHAQCRGQVQPVGPRRIARGKARLRRRRHRVGTAHPVADGVADTGPHAIVVGRLDIIVEDRVRTARQFRLQRVERIEIVLGVARPHERHAAQEALSAPQKHGLSVVRRVVGEVALVLVVDDVVLRTGLPARDPRRVDRYRGTPDAGADPAQSGDDHGARR